jgi:hypothetical protein
MTGEDIEFLSNASIDCGSCGAPITDAYQDPDDQDSFLCEECNFNYRENN